jgi:phosphoribosylformylglycinamidine cyclo-ligase
VVEKGRLIDGSDIRQGDVLIGVASSGLHSNGYSLARYVLLEKKKMKLGAYSDELGCTLGEELLRPTIIYVRLIKRLTDRGLIKAAAHITGGGIVENLPRVFPKRFGAVINTGSWETPRIFELIRRLGAVGPTEMLRTFNNGLGMILVVDRNKTDKVLETVRSLKQKAAVIGEIRRLRTGGQRVEFV